MLTFLHAADCHLDSPFHALPPDQAAERRQELVKQARKTAEDAKVAVRNIRRDAIEAIRKDKKANLVTEDDVAALEKKCQDITNEYTKKIDALLKEKEGEILEV